MKLLGFSRGQGSVEFALVLGAILAVVVAVMGRSYEETELTLAFASARLGALDAISSNSSLSLASIGYSASGRSVTFEPVILFNSAAISDSQAVRAAMLKKIRDSLSPGSAVPTTSFSTVLHDYYVEFP